MKQIKVDVLAIKKMNDAGYGYVGPVLSWALRENPSAIEQVAKLEAAVKEGRLEVVTEDSDRRGYWIKGCTDPETEIQLALDQAQLAITEYYNGDRAWASSWLTKARLANL